MKLDPEMYPDLTVVPVTVADLIPSLHSIPPDLTGLSVTRYHGRPTRQLECRCLELSGALGQSEPPGPESAWEWV